jgi:hypothetical protein
MRQRFDRLAPAAGCRVTTIATGYRLRVQTGPGQIEIEANIGGMPSPLMAQVATGAAPAWHHVVLTYLNALGQEKAELYIDGQLSASTSGIFDVVTAQSLRFGGGYLGLFGEVTYPYPGLLDEVALYLNYLPQTESKSTSPPQQHEQSSRSPHLQQQCNKRADPQRRRKHQIDARRG